MTAPLVSVILPTFNRLAYLRQAIDSVFAQSHADWELVIADDGSEPETRAYLAGLAAGRRVRIIWLPHTGNPSVARNCALRSARGAFVAFLDSDDVWLPRKLEIQLAAHEADPRRRWSYTGLARIDESGRFMPDTPRRYWVPFEGAIFEQLLTLEAVVATPSVIADRRLIEAAGGFDEQQLFFEEYDLWLRLIGLSEVTLIDEPLVLVRSHDQHYSADRVGVYEARARMLDKAQSRATTGRLRRVLRMERAKNSTRLAAAHAVYGRLPDVMQALWGGRDCARRSFVWWGTAARTVARAALRRPLAARRSVTP